jgi:hypothetical protein
MARDAGAGVRLRLLLPSDHKIFKSEDKQHMEQSANVVVNSPAQERVRLRLLLLLVTDHRISNQKINNKWNDQQMFVVNSLAQEHVFVSVSCTCS